MKTTEKGEEKDMIAIAQKITASPAATPAEMALRIKREAPTLAGLNPEQLEQIARLVMTQRLAAELNTAVNLAGIDWQSEKETFLAIAGESDHTRRGYRNALGKLEAWAVPQRINPLELNPAQADDFIYSIRTGKNERTGKENSPATVRITAAAVSSFYTWLHRRHTSIENPFRGSKARPKEKAVRVLAVPTEKELKIMLKELPPEWAAAVSIMAGLGLRCGALPGLTKSGDRYKVLSKGKTFYTDLTPDITGRVEAAGLPLREPYRRRTANSIELAVAYHIGKLYKAGKIAAAYSCHDFRHFAAIREYGKHRDIKRVRDFLHHSSIAITERYLRGIGVKV
jgi:integrase